MAAEVARGAISTILFTDVVDSTILMQRLGDERAQHVFERHHHERALALLDHARRRFDELGMNGWLRRAGKAANELGHG